MTEEIAALKKRIAALAALKKRSAALEDLCDTAWGVIANASGGNWNEASPEWREAAARWREQWHTALKTGTAQEKDNGGN